MVDDAGADENGGQLDDAGADENGGQLDDAGADENGGQLDDAGADGESALQYFERRIAEAQSINHRRYPRVRVISGGAEGYATHVTTLRVAVDMDGKKNASYYKPEKIEIVPE